MQLEVILNVAKLTFDFLFGEQNSIICLKTRKKNNMQKMLGNKCSFH